MDEPGTQPPTKRQISPLLLILVISGLMGLFAAVAMLLSEARAAPQALDEITQTRSLRDWRAGNFELPSLSGDTVQLSDYEDRIIFLNFWRTDCPPCVRELPAFQQFVNAQANNGAVVLAVNQGEQAMDIESFLGKINIEHVPVLLDEDLTLDNQYPVNNLPTTYIIGRDGYVHYMKIGELTVEDMNRYVNLLDDPAPSQG